MVTFKKDRCCPYLEHEHWFLPVLNQCSLDPSFLPLFSHWASQQLNSPCPQVWDGNFVCFIPRVPTASNSLDLSLTRHYSLTLLSSCHPQAPPRNPWISRGRWHYEQTKQAQDIFESTKGLCLSLIPWVLCWLFPAWKFAVCTVRSLLSMTSPHLGHTGGSVHF